MIQSIIENFVETIPDHIAVRELNTGKEISYLSLYEEAKRRSNSIDDTPYGIICLPDGIDCVIEFLAYAFIKKPFLVRHPSRSIYEISLQDKFLKENFHPITDGYQIRSSSGTTDLAKFYFSTQSEIVSKAQIVGKRLRIIPSDTVYCVSHMTNNPRKLFWSLLHGATLYCNNNSNLDIKVVISNIIQYKPSVITSTPIVLSIISKAVNTKLSPRVWSTGGAPLNYEHALKIENQIFGVVVNELGRTESSYPQMCSIDDPQDKRLKTTGKVDIDRVKMGENGEILISRDVVSSSMTTKFEGDWYDTGDLGTIDEDGYLVITGRKKLLISFSGRDINPIEVEALCSGKSCLVGIDRDLCLCVEDDTDPRDYIRAALNINIKYLWRGEIPELHRGKIDRIKMTEIIHGK